MSNIIKIEIPPGFVVREEAHKAAYENGFRVELGARDGWLGYRSTTARGEIWIGRSAGEGPWLLSITHAGVAAELGIPTAEDVFAPGYATYSFSPLNELYDALDRVYKLVASLPDAPLEAFTKATAHLPKSTETERPTSRPIPVSSGASRLLGRPLPAYRHYGYRVVASFAHCPMGRVRKRRPSPRRAQRTIALCTLGCCVRLRPCQFRRRR